jgi:hypothetical protein
MRGMLLDVPDTGVVAGLTPMASATAMFSADSGISGCSVDPSGGILPVMMHLTVVAELVRPLNHASL